MNTQVSIWSDLPLSTGIATLVCYAGVFNDVIGIEDMASRLGVSGQAEFYSALNKLHDEGRIVMANGFAALPDLEDKITVKAAKMVLTKQLISSRMNHLKKLGRNPLIRFVGISGSLAANNPTRDRNNHLDLDVFLITRNQCLWIYNIFRGIRNRFPRSRQEPELCINYVMDESDLMVANRNFYTATEIRNLIPVSGFDSYGKFLKINDWVNHYYPRMPGAATAVPITQSSEIINKLFYILYTMLRSIRWLDVDIIKKISFKTDPHGGISFHLLRPPYGGYQALVQKKFNRLSTIWFPDMLDAALVEKLFPDELSVEIRSGVVDVAIVAEEIGLGDAYSKYG